MYTLGHLHQVSLKKIPAENIQVNPKNDKKDQITNPEGNKPCM